jgi:hypothetical protein
MLYPFFCRVSTIQGGEGFLPSTVSKEMETQKTQNKTLHFFA